MSVELIIIDSIYCMKIPININNNKLVTRGNS